MENLLEMAIESYLDANGGFDSLKDIYPIIADLCRAKADHVRSNWQDEALAYIWERYAKAADAASIAYERAANRID